MFTLLPGDLILTGTARGREARSWDRRHVGSRVRRSDESRRRVRLHGEAMNKLVGIAPGRRGAYLDAREGSHLRPAQVPRRGTRCSCRRGLQRVQSVLTQYLYCLTRVASGMPGTYNPLSPDLGIAWPSRGRRRPGAAVGQGPQRQVWTAPER